MKITGNITINRIISVLFLALLMSFVSVDFCWSAEGSTVLADKGEVLHKVGLEWLRVAGRMIGAKRYVQAEIAAEKAGESREYLAENEGSVLAKIESRLEEVRQSRAAIEEHLSLAGELFSNGEYFKSKAHADASMMNEYIDAEQNERAKQILVQIDEQLGMLRKQMVVLYNRSVEDFGRGYYDTAREGFLQVAASGVLVTEPGGSAESYLQRIEDIERRDAAGTAMVTVADMDVAETSGFGNGLSGDLANLEMGLSKSLGAGPEELEPLTIEQVERQVRSSAVLSGEREKVSVGAGSRADVVRGYVKAVVNDAIEKAQAYIQAEDLESAKESIKSAEALLEDRRDAIGEVNYQQHKSSLGQMMEKIVLLKLQQLSF